ncbi:hypothetical protein D3C72_2093810 [compost metagenome]
MAPNSWPLAWRCAAVNLSCGWTMRMARSGSDGDGDGDGDKIGGFNVSIVINNAGKTIWPSYSEVFPTFRSASCVQKTYCRINKTRASSMA